MSQVEIAQIIAITAVAVAAAAVVLVILLYRRLEATRREQRVILGPKGVPGDIISFVSALSGRIDRLRDSLEALALEVQDHETRIDGCLSRVGVVRFDAYNELGGRQSTAIGLLNAKDEGLVITTVVSRDFARMYVKTVKGSESDIPLAPEEEEALALARARASAPFTVRPRPTPQERETVEQAAATPIAVTLTEEVVTPEQELGWPALEESPEDEKEEDPFANL